MARHCVARGNDRNYRWRIRMVNHPLLTTIEEFNREKYYYKLYLVKINYIYKNKFNLFIL